MTSTTEADALRRELLRPTRWYRYFQQGEQWWPNGKPPVAIADMDETWRYNASGWLVREADRLSRLFAEGCMAETLWVDMHVTAEMAHDGLIADLEQEADLARRSPAAWVMQTPLYLALVAGLPTKGAKRRKLGARASHWAGCPGREDAKAKECLCVDLAAEHLRGATIHERTKG